MIDPMKPDDDHGIDADDAALEAFLSEVLGQTSPPDLTDRIMHRLERPGATDAATHDRRDGHGSDASSPDFDEVLIRSLSTGSLARVAGEKSAPSFIRSVAWVSGVAVAVAGCFLLAIWLRFDRTGTGGTLTQAQSQDRSISTDVVAANDGSSDASSATSDSPLVDPRTSTDDASMVASQSHKPGDDSTPDQVPSSDQDSRPGAVRGIPMQIVDVQDPPSAVELIDDSPRRHTSQPPAAVTLVSTEVNDAIHKYWESVGIVPVEDADATDVMDRLQKVLGVQLPSGAIGQPEALYRSLTQPDTARAFARHWLNRISDGSLRTLDAKARKGLITELATCLMGRRPLDEVMASWIDGTSEHSASFYRLMGSGNNGGVLQRRLAALTMNQDLRCTRCHDSLLDSEGRQEDYWSFTALLKRSVVLDADGKLKIDDPKSKVEVYYELPDGRQRLAQPAVSPQWVRADQPIKSVRQWAGLLRGSDELARGVVNSLWQCVHGRPLRGRVADPLSAPYSESLQQIEDELVADLVASRFDVARTLALILATPVTHRQVPQALQPQNVFAASDEALEDARNAVNAFAAAMPPATTLPVNRRVDQALRAVGAALDSQGRPFVAQLGDPAASGQDPDPETNALSDDFPAPTGRLPVQWLARIKDSDQQLQHLAYLAGRTRLPENVAQAAEKMLESENRTTTLNRIWWILKP